MNTRLLVLLALARLSAAAVPQSATYSGTLTDGGAPVTGARDMTFRLYAAEEGGSPLFEELHAGVMVTAGSFTVTLGSSSPLSDATFDGSVLWLEVEVAGTVLAPRSAVRSVPYAVRADVAADADTLGGMAAADFAPTAHSHGSCTGTDKVIGVDATGHVLCGADANSGGDVTAVTAGAGLTGGGGTGDVSLAVDFAVAQRRVTGSCAAGHYVQSVALDGTVTCGVDAGGASGVTSVTPGAGLTGGGASGDVSLAVDFGGSGSATTVARSDHTHPGGGTIDWASMVYGRTGSTTVSVGSAGRSDQSVSVICDAGDLPLGGGCWADFGGASGMKTPIVGSRPTPLGWECQYMENPESFGWLDGMTLTAYVRCLNATAP